MTPLERDLINLAKMARRKDIKPQFILMREKHGSDAVVDKLNQCFSEDGARELLTWLAEEDSVEPDTPPVPEPSKPKDQFSIDGAVGYYKGRKEMPSRAVIDKEMKSARIDGGRVWMSYDELRGWKIDHGEKDLDGHVCIAFVADTGELIAGRFDHKKVGQKDKGLENILPEKKGPIISFNGHGYVPRKGQEVAFFILDRTGNLRTNTVKTVWK